MINAHTDDRGQVGIGTLIVFIAMVLVAAIAAGVLINTAGFLQTQAQTTGEESTAQVADNVQVVNQVGYTGYSNEFQNTNWEQSTGPADDQIQRIELTVQKSPGAAAIDLSEATVEYLADEAETLTHVDVAFNNDDIDAGATLNSTDDYFFATRQVRGDSSSTVLINDDDRSAIVVPLGTYQDDSAAGTTDAAWVDTDGTVTQPGFLSAGEEVTFVVTTAQGSKAEVSLEAPDLMNDEPAVRL